MRVVKLVKESISVLCDIDTEKGRAIAVKWQNKGYKVVLDKKGEPKLFNSTGANTLLNKKKILNKDSVENFF